MNDLMKVQNTTPSKIFQQVEMPDWDFSEGITSGGFPVLTHESGRWKVSRGDTDEVLVNKEGDPRSSLPVVIVNARPTLSKTYYNKPYVQGDDQQPTCRSIDGITPDSDSEQIQANSCGVCPHNKFGTRRGADGELGEGKACTDTKRLAVILPSQEVVMFRVPPTSLQPLREYEQWLKRNGKRLFQVFTKLKFDASVTYSKPVFEFVGVVEQDEVAQLVVDKMWSDEVMNMLAMDPPGTPAKPAEPAAAPSKPAPPKPAPVAPAAPPEPPEYPDAEVPDMDMEPASGPVAAAAETAKAAKAARANGSAPPSLDDVNVDELFAGMEDVTAEPAEADEPAQDNKPTSKNPAVQGVLDEADDFFTS